MTPVVHITPDFAVAAAVPAEELPRLAGMGFRTLVDLLPEGDASASTGPGALSQRAQCQGLAYHHIPAGSHELFTDPVVGPMAAVLAAAKGPVLAMCKSGTRAAIVWAAASARSEPVAGILEALAKAGFDLAFLRDDLDSQADRMRWAGPDAGSSAPLPHAPARFSSRRVA